MIGSASRYRHMLIGRAAILSFGNPASHSTSNRPPVAGLRHTGSFSG
jgi:hypothetical protein